MAGAQRREYRVMGAIHVTAALVCVFMWIVKDGVMRDRSMWLAFAVSFALFGTLRLLWGWALEVKS